MKFSRSPVASVASLLVAFSLIGGVSRAEAAGFTVLTAFPQTNGVVNAMVVDSANSVIYLGGAFSTVGGQARNHLAAVNARTGALLPWNPGANGIVYALTQIGSTIYVGGDFAVAGGEVRTSLAAIDATTGAATSWAPACDGSVFTLATDGSFIYVAGLFNNVGGAAYAGLAKLAVNNGSAQPGWNPNPTVYSTNLMMDVSIGALQIAVSGTKLYVRGTFDKIGGQTRYGIAELNLSDATVTAWNPNPSAAQPLYGMAVDGTNVYIGGSFTSMGGQNRSNLAAVAIADGNATNWNPGADGIIQSFAIDGGTIYAGGGFNTIGGLPRNGLAALDAATGAVKGWNPGANNSITTLSVLAGSTVFVSGDNLTTVGGAARTGFAAVTENAIVPPVTPTAPVVKVSGKKSVTTTKSALTLKGTASVADGSVAKVAVKVGKSGAKTAKGAASWSFKAKLKPGKNVITITATGTNGLTSKAVKVTVIRQ